MTLIIGVDKLLITLRLVKSYPPNGFLVRVNLPRQRIFQTFRQCFRPILFVKNMPIYFLGRELTYVNKYFNIIIKKMQCLNK